MTPQKSTNPKKAKATKKVIQVFLDQNSRHTQTNRPPCPTGPKTSLSLSHGAGPLLEGSAGAGGERSDQEGRWHLCGDLVKRAFGDLVGCVFFFFALIIGFNSGLIWF